MKFLGYLLLIGCCGWCYAATIDVIAFADHSKQQRYQRLTHEFRCLVCQNQDLAESDAPLARDLRDKIVDMLQKDWSDKAIEQYMRDRYGEFVLFKPSFSRVGWVLWVGPFVFLIVGFGLAWSCLRKKHRATKEQSCAEHEQC